MKTARRYVLNCAILFTLLFSAVCSWGFSFNQAAKDTVISGNICGIWSKDYRYIIDSNVNVPADCTLEIKPGVVILLGEKVRITVNGSLIANGTSSDSIYFIPKSTNYWNNITFRTSKLPVINYCYFKNTAKSEVNDPTSATLYGALHFNSVSRLDAITNCTFENNRDGAVYIEGSSNSPQILFENNNIRNGGVFGIVCRAGTYKNLIFNKNVIEGDISNMRGFTGIRIYETKTGKVSLNHNVIDRGIYKGLIDHDGRAIHIESPRATDIGEVELYGDLVRESEGNIAAVYMKAVTFRFTDVIIKNNYGTSSGGCHLIGNYFYISGSEFSYNKNKIVNPVSSPIGGGGLALDVDNTNAILNISTSVFLNNSVFGLEGAALRIIGNNFSAENLSVQSCSFVNNETNYNGGAVGISVFDIIKTVNFSGNSFNGNKAKGNAGGGGIWVDLVNEISSFTVQESTKIADHDAEYGSGGFLSVNNQVKKVNDFKFISNKCGGYSKASGDGGLVFLNVNQIDKIDFSENTAISGESGKSGGVLFCRNISNVTSLQINKNIITSAVAKTAEGGAFFLSHQNLGTFSCINNVVDNSLSGTNGGFVSLINNSTSSIRVDANKVKGASVSKGSGGFLYLNSKNLLNTFSFSSNVINSSTATGDGGVVYSTYGEGEKITIEKNNISSSKSDNRGGNVFLNSRSYTSSFKFSDNTILNSASKGSGGSLFINQLSGNEILIAYNTITKSVSENQGGSYYIFNSNTLNSLVIRGNIINTSESTNDGGVVFCKANLSNKLYHLMISDNNVTSAVSKAAKGGFGSFTGTVSQNVSFNMNVFGSSTAESDGGLLYFYPNTLANCDLFSFNSNKINANASSVKGTGGILSGEGNIKNIKIINNEITKASSFGAGGGFSWKNLTVPIAIQCDNNKILESKSGYSSGGFLYLESYHIDSFKITNNNIAKLEALQSGGGFFIQSLAVDKEISLLQIENNTFNNAATGNGEGGILKIYSPSSIRKMLILGNHFTGGIFKSALNGGVLAVNVESVKIPIIKLNSFEGKLQAKNGGFLYLEANLPENDLSGKFEISDNTINADLQVDINGGFIFQTGKNDISLLFDKNIFKKSIKAGNAGGILFIRNNEGNCKDIVLTGNSYSPTTGNNLTVKTGGFAHFDGKFRNNKFVFSGNTVTKTSADSTGAIIYIQNPTFGYYQNVLRFDNNVLTELQSGINGGILSMYGSLGDSLSVRGNIIKNIKSVNVQSNGGAFYLKNERNLKNISFLHNSVDGISSLSGNGAVLRYDGNDIFSMCLIQNYFNSLSSGLTGAFDLSFVNLTAFRSELNEYRNISGQKGSLFHFKGKGFSAIENFRMFRDLLDNSRASLNGGGIFFDINRLNAVLIDSLDVRGFVADNDGGFIAGSEGIEVGTFDDKYNTFRDCIAKHNGGVIALSGRIGEITIENSDYSGNFADNYGGTYFLDGNGNNEGKFSVSDSKFYDGLTSGFGGAFYIRSLSTGNISDCDFINLPVKQDGGAVNAQFGSSLTFTDTKFERNKARDGNGGAVVVLETPEVRFLRTPGDSAYFYKNEAPKGSGGGLFMENGNLFLKSARFDSCKAYRGGGAFLKNTGGEMDTVCFRGNEVYVAKADIPGNLDINNSTGGGLFIYSNRINQIKIKDSDFENNKGYMGGGSYLEDANVLFTRCIFDNNSSVEDGAAGCFYYSPEVTMVNCIIQGNTIGNNSDFPLPAAGIYMYFREPVIVSPRFINCAFRLNNSYALGASYNIAYSPESFTPVEVRNSILYYNNYTNAKIPQYDGDPHLFCFYYSCVANLPDNYCGKASIKDLPDWEDDLLIGRNIFHRYCLKATSPCRNAGSPDQIYNDIIPWSNNGLTNDMGITGGPYAFTYCPMGGKDTLICVSDDSETRIAGFSEAEFLMYPNPTSGKLSVKPAFVIHSDLIIEVFSTYGKLIFNKKINTWEAQNIIQLDLSGLPRGMYLITVQNNESKSTRKIVLM